MTTALVVAAHPDDEVLGCGGTIARLVDSGWSVHTLILAEGSTSRDPSRNRAAHRAVLEDLESSALRAGQILGTTSTKLEAFPDNRMDGIELLDIVKLIESEVARLQPVRVLTHHFGDVNVDHSVIHQAVAAACRPVPGACVRQILFFEVPSSTEWRPAHSSLAFAPSHFVDIGSTLARKLDALRAYASELRPFPHPRSVQAVESLARWRGATAGCEAAEAFEVGRWIE